MHIRDLQLRVYDALAKVAASAMVLPDEDLMASPTGCILAAPRTSGATDTASADALRATLDEIIRRLRDCHTA